MPTAAERIRGIAELEARQKPKVALDTCCVQYYISDPPVQPWADCLDPIFRAALDGRIELYVSTVVVSELLAHVHFAHRNRGYDPELDLLAILNRHFQILEVDGEVARAAGRLRGNYVPGDKMALKTQDALIGATSIANGHTLFVTNDARLADALPDESCIYLRTAALELLEQRFPAPCLEEADPVTPARRGPGLPRGVSLASLELGSVRPNSSAGWRRLLADAFTVASALNEPCVFFVLTRRSGRRTETEEVLFWHPALEEARPAKRILRRAREHLEVRYDEDKDRYLAAPGKAVYGFFFTSMARERARQSQPCYASKSDHQREADAWNGYLAPLWRFRSALSLPQTTWLFCEEGEARLLESIEVLRFLDQAKNVLGWEDGQ
jgi:predicted nucleic acid-binding protein